MKPHAMTIFVLVLCLASFIKSAQSQELNLPDDPAEAFLLLMENTDVKAARRELQGSLFKPKVFEKTVTKTVYVRCWARCGIFGLRKRLVMVPRQIQSTVKETRQVLSADIAYGQIEDSRRGYSKGKLAFAMLPNPVGAKPTFIVDEVLPLLPAPKLSQVSGNAVVALTPDFPENSTSGTHNIYEVQVLIDGTRDHILLITVSAQQKDNGVEIREKKKVDDVATAFRDDLIAALRKLSPAG